MPQHIAGAKHQAKLRGDSSAPFVGGAKGKCIYFPQGKCYRGSACPYLHDSAASSSAPLPSPMLAVPSPCRANAPLFVATSDVSLASVPAATSVPLAASVPVFELSRPFLDGTVQMEGTFMLSKSLATAAAAPTLPAQYRDLLKRKRNVNLYISGGVVMWQFAYNEQVKEAIKTHIKGRQWNPKLGEKGCWTCPLESLPDAVALYEHMGRAPDPALKARAEQMISGSEGCSPADVIRLTVQLLGGVAPNAAEGSDVIGRVLCNFQYDADVVTAIKQLAPQQRSYNAQTKEWPIDLLALPELLAHLEPLQYAPTEHLQALTDVCKRIECLLYEPVVPPTHAVVATTADLAQANENTVSGLKAALADLQRLVRDKDPDGLVIDRSDCGQPKKRRKLTALLADGYESDDGDSSWLTGLYDRVSLFAQRAPVPAPAGCDCGQPWKRVGGRHVCRYFGHFHCSCGNRWTSAYTWKGEQQKCRACNRESNPTETKPLDGRIGTSNGEHDTARCSMCAQLGYNCSR